MNSTTEENKSAKKAPAKKAPAKKAPAKKAPAKKASAKKAPATVAPATKKTRAAITQPSKVEMPSNPISETTSKGVGGIKNKEELINNKDWLLIFDSKKDINLKDYIQVKPLGLKKYLTRNIIVEETGLINSTIILIEGIGITTEKDNKNNIICRKFF